MTTALYRRYRPQTFAEVIGQDHVTAPLRAALRNGQVHHAYLFSGPRGCGKTSSARILARCLNCAKGPTDTPCGECDSCVELATGGPGSLDVVEIDAASHNGVDDARELRERATFAPARDRYKVFILDEAHMVTTQAFNALLKIVEEPPPHIRFVFATTEPDRVIGTIRSRTHHYPFRLVPPDVLQPYLEHVCEAEGVAVGSGVLPLVVRAGGGSVRDSLSVLDQLMAGAGGGGLDYEGAIALLGYTPAALLDDLVDAIAARDGATAFSVVERVISTGHEPRRFVEDLLERLRDLIVIAASGEAASAALGAVPADRLDRMRAQATHLGWSELSRSADLANAALTEMVGATSPRLHLELLMARLLLPAADDGAAGFGARLDRLERGWSPAPTEPAPVTTPAPEPSRPPRLEPSDQPVEPPADEWSRHAGDTPAEASSGSTRQGGEAPAAEATAADAAPATGAVAGHDTEMLRRRWPEVLDTAKGLRRASWILVGQNAQVQGLDASVLWLSFPTQGLVDRFRDHADVIARAVRETLGFDVHVQATVGGAPTASSGTGTTTTPTTAPTSAATGTSAGGDPAPRPAGGHGIPSAEEAAASWDAPARPPSSGQRSSAAGASPSAAPSASGSSSATRPAAAPAAAPVPADEGAGEPAPGPRPVPDDDLDDPPIDPPDDEVSDDVPPEEPMASVDPGPDGPSDDDPVIEGSNLVGAPLVARLLGGTVIDEQVDGPAI